MAQVVTSENIAELVTSRTVAEFVAPGTEPAVKAEEPKPASGEAAETPKTETAEQPKAEEKKADDELPEKVQKRINEKHRHAKEAEEFAKAQYLEKLAAEKRVGELEAEIASLKKSNTPAPAEEAKPPRQEDFATVQEYLDAAVAYGIDAKLKEREAQSAEAAKARAEAEIQAAHVKRFKAFEEKNPEVAALIGKSDLDLKIPLMQYIRESDAGPELAGHLAQNPDVAERLNRLSPIKALAELGKLEVALAKPAEKSEAPKAEQPKPAMTKAPAPIKPLGGNSEPVHKDPANMTFPELRAHNEQQRRLKAQQQR